MLDRRESVQTDGNTIECNDVSREAIIGQRVGKMALQNPKADARMNCLVRLHDPHASLHDLRDDPSRVTKHQNPNSKRKTFWPFLRLTQLNMPDS